MTSLYARATEVVWRSAPDRVIVQRLDPVLAEPVVDLLGGAALVWTALDSPADADELQARLTDAGIVIEWADALERMVAEGLVVALPEVP